MISLSLILLGGTLVFYILRVLFNSEEFNWLTLTLSVCTVASVVTDSEIADNQIAYFVVPLFYVIAMSVVYIIYGERK